MGVSRTVHRLRDMTARAVTAVLLLLLPFAASAQPQHDELAGIGALLASDQADEANCRLQQALANDRRTDGGRRQAVIYLLLAGTELALGRPDVARADFDHAEKRFEALRDDFGRWMTNWAAAELERQEGQYDAAIVRHEQALAALHAASSAPLSIESLKALGPAFGFPTEALGPAAAMPELIKPIILAFAEAGARDAYAAALLEIDQLGRAEVELATASELSKLFPGLFDTSIAIHTGDLRRRQWRLDEARNSYKTALASVETMPVLFGRSDSLELRILGRLEEVERLGGRIDDALAHNDRALQLARSSRNPKREASILEARASLLIHGSRYVEAEAILKSALTIAERNDDFACQASVMATLGAMNMLRGRYGTSAANFEKSLELYQKLNMPYVEAPVWIELAEVYLLLDDDKNAAIALGKARDAAKRGVFPLAAELVGVIEALQKSVPGKSGELEASLSDWLENPEAKGLMFGAQVEALMRAAAATLANRAGVTTLPSPFAVTASAIPSAIPVALAGFVRGHASYRSGDMRAAREAWSAALRINPSRDLRAGLLALIGASHWREGHREEATRVFLKAAEALELAAGDVRTEELIGSYLGNSRHVYFEILIEMLGKQGKFAAAFDYTERARARAFLQLVGNARLDSARGASAPLVREAEALRREIAAKARDSLLSPSSEHPLNLQQARERYEALLTRLKTSSPEYASLSKIEPLQIDDVRRELRDGTTLISYFVTGSGVHAWILDRLSLHHVALPADADAFRRIVCWANQVGGRTRGVRVLNRPCGTATATAEEAFQLLFAPLEAKIANQRLIIVPHNVLHYVPFAALRNAATGRYLIEDYVITYAPSASAIRFMREKESAVRGKALVLGDPDSTAGKLGGSQREAIEVARALGSAPLIGPRATESVLHRLHGEYDLVHVAAHGRYDSLNPLFSHLALAPDDAEDGNLEVHEILSRVDLGGVNLVVLSACESALGKGSRGDDVVGLTRALLYAGTPAVISTLWDIDDDATTNLMAHFYERFCSGESAADA